MRRFHKLLTGCAALLVCLAGVGASAQTERATLRGTVADASGSSIPGAEVSITEIKTSIEARHLTTDYSGNYEAADLKPSTYRVSISAPNFQQFIANSMLLDPGQIRRLDVKLKVGATSETVTVDAGAALIQTEGGTISRQVDLTDYTSSAVVDRSATPVSTLVTTPGMQGNGWNMIMSGIPSGNLQTWSMDGIAGDTGSGGGGSDTAQMANPEFFETVEATTVNARPDASRAVGFNMVSKRGTNDYHGSVLWREGNSALGARKYFDPRNTPFILHTGAASFGGPIIKDRTFFYAGWWHQVVPLGSWYQATVPTAQMRNGDFSQFLNPATAPNGKVTVLIDPVTKQPFANNQIADNRVNAVSKKLLDYWPLPNVGNVNRFTNNNGRNDVYPAYKIDYILGRIDHQLTKSNSIFVRWLGKYNPGALVSGPSASFDYNQARNDFQTVVSDTWVLSPKFVNNFTFGYTSESIRYGNAYAGTQTPLFGDDVVNDIGLQGVNQQGFHSIGFPNTAISGTGGVTTLSNTSGCLGGLGGQCSGNGLATYREVATWSVSKHVIAFGGEYNHYKEYQGSIPTSVYGGLTFNGSFSGIAFADFLLGLPNNTSRLQNPVVNRHIHQNQMGLFVDDTVKLNPKLTISYGLRWDFYGVPQYDDGLVYNFDPATANIVVPRGTLSKVSPLFPRTINVVEGNAIPSAKLSNFRPRVSAAYRFTDKTVLRGGYGEFTESWGYGASGHLSNAGPFQLSESYTNQNVADAGSRPMTYHPLFSFPNPFLDPAASAVPSQNATYIPMHNDEGVLRQYNVTLEQQIGNTLGFRLSYVGMRGTGLNYSLNINKPHAQTKAFQVSDRPWPQFNSVTAFRNDGGWRRNALQFEVQKRAGMLTLDANFNWASNLENFYNTQDPYNVTNRWARDGNERKLYLSNRATLALPFGRHRRYLARANRITDAAIGGWGVQAVVTFASGQYTSPSYTGPDPAHASPGNVTQLPDCVGDPYAVQNRTHNNWWNIGAFAPVPANSGRYGNCNINILELYPIHNANMSLSKQWSLTERIHMLFALQIANVTNTPTFASANTNISGANFGAFTSVYNYNQPEQNGYRQMDGTLRIRW